MAPTEEPVQKIEEASPAPKKSKKAALIAGIIAAVFVVEGATVLIAVKIINRGPAEAVGVPIPTEVEKTHVEDPHEQTEELLIANQFECPHTNTGRLYVIRMTIYAVVPKSLVEVGEGEGKEGHKEKKEGEGTAAKPGLVGEIEKRIAAIKDRLRTAIAGADASTLCLAKAEKPDYGLSTLRRQFKTILDEVLGKGKVKDILISDYMPTPID